MKRLEGKVAVVTGGARDLGRAISVKLALEGAKVCLNYFDNEGDAKETLEMIKKDGGVAIAVQGDMTKAADVKRVFDEAKKAFGPVIHVLVNVVGGIVGRKLIGGSIVNFSSQAARDGGGPGASMYATAKAAVLCHTRAMAKELGPQGIRVNALAPGMINTSFHDRFTKPAARENLHNTAPLPREGEATEVADLVTFLACSESSYITGACIDINGGVLFS